MQETLNICALDNCERWDLFRTEFFSGIHSESFDCQQVVLKESISDSCTSSKAIDNYAENGVPVAVCMIFM